MSLATLIQINAKSGNACHVKSRCKGTQDLSRHSQMILPVWSKYTTVKGTQVARVVLRWHESFESVRGKWTSRTVYRGQLSLLEGRVCRGVLSARAPCCVPLSVSQEDLEMSRSRTGCSEVPSASR